MKKTALYILLFAYSTVIIKPVVPHISDAVAHIFYYSQHMATVHYENGKLHVHKEIIDNTKKDDPAKESPSSKKENSANDYINLLANYGQHNKPVAVSYFVSVQNALPNNYLPGNYLPPKA